MVLLVHRYRREQAERVLALTMKAGGEIQDQVVKALAAAADHDADEIPMLVRCFTSYEGAEASELCMQEGDILEVLLQEPSGWWQGRLVSTGEEGWFPSTFVHWCDEDGNYLGDTAPVSDTADSSDVAASQQQALEADADPGCDATGEYDNSWPSTSMDLSTTDAMQFAVYVYAVADFEASNETELGLVCGDCVEVLAEDDSGWWHGRVYGTEHEGWFPCTFVTDAEGNPVGTAGTDDTAVATDDAGDDGDPPPDTVGAEDGGEGSGNGAGDGGSNKERGDDAGDSADGMKDDNAGGAGVGAGDSGSGAGAGAAGGVDTKKPAASSVAPAASDSPSSGAPAGSSTTAFKPHYSFSTQRSARDVTWVGETFQPDEKAGDADKSAAKQGSDWFLDAS